MIPFIFRCFFIKKNRKWYFFWWTHDIITSWFFRLATPLNHGITFYLISIIKNYLLQREFVLKTNAFFSRSLLINAGIPQGGELCPSLFSIFINDIQIMHNNKSIEYWMLFADDINYLIYSKNLINEQKNLTLSKRAFYWISNVRINFDPNPKFLGINLPSYERLSPLTNCLLRKKSKSCIQNHFQSQEIRQNIKWFTTKISETRNHWKQTLKTYIKISNSIGSRL